MKTIWNKETGESRAYESVDAREILKNSDLYTDQNPNPPKRDKDGNELDDDGNVVQGGPQNVASVENEFRREPVGDDVPGPERAGTIIRNGVTDQPLMAVPAAVDPLDHDADGAKGGAVDLEGMTVPELKAHAEKFGIDLGDATRKDDIRAAIEKSGK